MKRGCVFMDRDGVINVKPPTGAYLASWEEVELIPGVVDWIRLFNAMGSLVVIVTNQRGIARGLTSRDAVEDIHRRMVELLAAQGACIDDVFYCPHEEGACDCRKPKPGLVFQARNKWDIDMAHSMVIGDSERDRGLAAAAGLPFVLVDKGKIVDVIRRQPR